MNSPEISICLNSGRKMLIGSKAAKFWYPDFREAKDTDYICASKIPGADCKINPAFQWILDNYNTEIAPPEVLYTLKYSHIFFNIKLKKHLYDLNFFQRKGLKVNEELFKQLYATWEVIHGKKRANLMKSNEDFFKDNVNRKYNHDALHDSIKFYDEPLFNKIKKDKSQAMCSKSMFFALSREDQIKTCQEEIFVTALERYLIPSDFTINPRAAYYDGFGKLLTSMTKGWFSRFLADNWRIFCVYPKHIDFVGKFKQNIKELEYA